MIKLAPAHKHTFEGLECDGGLSVQGLGFGVARDRPDDLVPAQCTRGVRHVHTSYYHAHTTARQRGEPRNRVLKRCLHYYYIIIPVTACVRRAAHVHRRGDKAGATVSRRLSHTKGTQQVVNTTTPAPGRDMMTRDMMIRDRMTRDIMNRDMMVGWHGRRGQEQERSRASKRRKP